MVVWCVLCSIRGMGGVYGVFMCGGDEDESACDFCSQVHRLDLPRGLWGLLQWHPSSEKDSCLHTQEQQQQHRLLNSSPGSCWAGWGEAAPAGSWARNESVRPRLLASSATAYCVAASPQLPPLPQPTYPTCKVRWQTAGLYYSGPAEGC